MTYIQCSSLTAQETVRSHVSPERKEVQELSIQGTEASNLRHPYEFTMLSTPGEFSAFKVTCNEHGSPPALVASSQAGFLGSGTQSERRILTLGLSNFVAQTQVTPIPVNPESPRVSASGQSFVKIPRRFQR